MRCYECECLKCGHKTQIRFKSEPYPEIGDIFPRIYRSCGETQHTRTLTRKAAAELRRKEQEEAFRQSIIDKCTEYEFQEW